MSVTIAPTMKHVSTTIPHILHDLLQAKLQSLLGPRDRPINFPFLEFLFSSIETNFYDDNLFLCIFSVDFFYREFIRQCLMVQTILPNLRLSFIGINTFIKSYLTSFRSCNSSKCFCALCNSLFESVIKIRLFPSSST